ncbi:hypothetical protein ACYF6T_13740 [Streptomyces sp. 7R007]
MRTRARTAEVEQRVRQLLGPADPVAADAPPDPAVLDRILAQGGPRSRALRRPGRRWVVGVAVAAVLGGGGLVAQAAGVIPGDVDWGLNRAGHGPGSHGMAPDTDRATMRFAGTTPDGLRMEYWTAPNASGGSCAYVRVLKDGRSTDGGWSECSRGGGNASTPALWCNVDTNALTDWVAVYGRAPRGAVSVRVVWRGGGAERPVDVGKDRYFLAFLPYNSQSNELWLREYSAQALDAHGRVVAVVDSDR